MDLSSYQWKNRILVVFAPSAEHLWYRSLENALRRQPEEIRERDLLVFHVFHTGQSRTDEHVLSTEETAALQRNFSIRPDQFSVILIGKDGGTKLRQNSEIGLAAIFATIDAMPMRQQELQERSEK